MAGSKYVDDEDAKSFVLCVAWLDNDGDGTQGIGRFKTADCGSRTKFLDMSQTFRCKKGKQPHLVFSLVLKNGECFQSKKEQWVVSSAPPWWNPYSVRILAGVFQGGVVQTNPTIIS